MKLTDRQKEVLSYISNYIDAWGKAPSFDEICSHFGFASYNTVSTHLNILEKKGYIRRPREKNKKRSELSPFNQVIPVLKQSSIPG